MANNGWQRINKNLGEGYANLIDGAHSKPPACEFCDSINPDEFSSFRERMPEVLEHLLTSHRIDLSPLYAVERFEAITPEIPDDWYFAYFSDIARRARNILAGRNDRQIHLCALINRVRTKKIYVDMDHTLAVLPDDQFDFYQSSQSISEISAMRRFFREQWSHLSAEPTIIVCLPDPEFEDVTVDFFQHEVFAVLAITKLVEAIFAFDAPLELLIIEDSPLNELVQYLESFYELPVHERDARMFQENLRVAAKFSMEAMEAINYAELKKLEYENRNEVQEKKGEQIRILQSDRHKSNREIKDMTIAEWDRIRSELGYILNAERNGISLSMWLSTKNIVRTPRVVAGWLREHAQNVGVRWR
ncbi:hypothetical protein F2P45_06295 [Massilia sp. CCM 8733]|uniref:Uncharacterized protein n=1 Tax=Massilia mucilaginosa TaxID=2609282 RepID=A0ABX0NPA5_9BURK|nr:hypothetical protein [Massilia mucilaginosa]NHZ88634.1 hypothetical protein [Massilia mucilaginosa]